MIIDKQTILLVDDIKENIDILVGLLNKYDLITALNAQDALEIINKEKVDLILLDIMMPIMSGFEVCKILKETPEHSSIPIIFLSAKDEHEDVEYGFKLGAVDYITKPFHANELISRVKTHLNLQAYKNNLEYRVAQEVEKNRIKQQIIYQQSKQASLGELLMHIAHQWKQPLASLGSINLLNKAKIESGKDISKEEYISSIHKSEELIMFMSETIDTFKNFYKPSPNDEYFYIYQSVLNVLSIIEITFNFENIKISIENKENEKIYGNINEFEQVIFSILNNAKDILKKRDIQNPKIHINIENKKIMLKDNGGGITKGMEEEIFLPNVSETGGTGIGLYLSKSIILKNNGTINVTNDKDSAIFCIRF